MTNSAAYGWNAHAKPNLLALILLAQLLLLPFKLLKITRLGDTCLRERHTYQRSMSMAHASQGGCISWMRLFHGHISQRPASYRPVSYRPVSHRHASP